MPDILARSNKCKSSRLRRHRRPTDCRSTVQGGRTIPMHSGYRSRKIHREGKSIIAELCAKFFLQKYKSVEMGTVTLVRVIGLSGNDKEGLKHVIIQARQCSVAFLFICPNYSGACCAIQSSVTSSPHDTVRRASTRFCGRRRTCPSRRRVWCPILFSIHTVTRRV